MAQPTRRDYIIVSVAMLVLALGGGWLAVNWRRLAAAYYIRQAENLAADPETVRAALEKAGRYDRKQLVAFWERELASLNRIEAAAAKTEPGIRVTAALRGRRYLIEEGEDLSLDIVLRNETGQDLHRQPKLFQSDFYFYDLATWAAHRREPTTWRGVKPILGLGSGYKRRPFPPLPPGGEFCESDRFRYVAPIAFDFAGTSGVGQYPPPGLYRVCVNWFCSRGQDELTGKCWVVLRVLPKPQRPGEEWSLFPETELSPLDASWRLWRYYEKRSGAPVPLETLDPDVFNKL